jgi:single-strand DNA-binding protein
MSSLNSVQLIGNVGKDPEIRSTQSGSKVANLRIATTEKWKDKSGERQERTEWHTLVVWGQLADIVEKYVTKGSKVYVRGKLTTREWEKDGAKRYSTEVVLQGFGAELILLDSKNGGGERSAPSTSSARMNDSYDEDAPF